MIKKNQIDIIVNRAVNSLKKNVIKKIKIEKIINKILNDFEKDTGQKIKNKPYTIEYK